MKGNPLDDQTPSPASHIASVQTPQTPPAPSTAPYAPANPVPPQAAATHPQVPVSPQLVTVDASILTELREMRIALEANNAATLEALERIAIGTSDDEDENGPVLQTPAALDTPSTRKDKKQVDSVDDDDASHDPKQPVGARRSKSDGEAGRTSRMGVPKIRVGESKSDYIERLRKLPPIGPKSRRFGESREVFRARLFDGSEGDEPRPTSKN